ncbi:MAG: hypothetical protein ACUVRZ_12280 [Desulfobacca sp.]|uniref:hypothetical protein n=1 Tax=Desulfobacca sp. TaxID=2067990 RepID=UPI004049C752
MIDEKVKYLKVKDAAGNEYLCPLDALKTLDQATDEELANCVEAEVVGRYSSDHEVVNR